MAFRISGKEAKKSLHTKHKVGAAIVKGGRILATGFNSLSPSYKLKTKTRHAEAAAILKMLNGLRLHDLAGADMYVTRFTKGGVTGMAKPCTECQKLMRSVGIKRTFYTTDNNTTEMMKL